MSYPYRSQYQYDRVPGRRRVVVTGMGAVSAAGVGTKALWDALLAGRSCIGRISQPAAGLPISVAGEVRDFDATRHIEAWQRPRRMGRVMQFAVAAGREAFLSAGLRTEDLQERKVAVMIGSAVSSYGDFETSAVQVEKRGASSITPTNIAASNFQAPAIAVAQMLKTDHVSAFGVSNNCTSGTDAIGNAVDMIRLGRYDIVVAGGTEAPLTPAVTSIISASGICTTHSIPEEASRPFDRDREGGVIGEGAGVFILEEREAALERGAKPLLEIFSFHMHPDMRRDLPGSGLEYTMRGALENASCRPQDIDYISAWGCGAPLIDRCETEAIKAVFGDDAYRVAVGSIKGTIGIPLGASGPLQLIVTACAHRDGVLPPTVNWRHRDLDCDLDYIGGGMRRARLRKSLINAHGLSGGNISLLVGSA